MDAYEIIRIVYSRVQNLEPENVSKIMGYLLFQDNGNQEMLRLAFSPDALLQLYVSRAKKELGLAHPVSTQKVASSLSSLSQISQFASDVQIFSPSIESMDETHLPTFSPSKRALPSQDQQLRAGRIQNPEQQTFSGSNRTTIHDQMPIAFDRFRLYSEQQGPRDGFNQHDFLYPNGSSSLQHSPNARSNDNLHPDVYTLLKSTKFNVEPFAARLNGNRLPDLIGSPDNGLAPGLKPCMYYARGYCKHGSSCRFLHNHGRPDPSFPVSLNSQRDSRIDEGLSLWSLETLEQELKELLKDRRIPVSIASLPQLYFERYGKSLQAEGYLTESQRHGKAGYNLTKLLARLKNTVTLIDRPHGQHAVVLAEEAYKFLSYRAGQDELVEVNPGSRQIYLTFPAESTFTEEDVAAHFRIYGPVQDVRIPYQQKRMFGFVTFVYPETVKAILGKGNPHYVCGARVLVKPYKEKGKQNDSRKLSDRGENSGYVLPSWISEKRNYDFCPGSSFFDDREIFRNTFQEQSESLELERRRLADLQLVNIQRQFAEIESPAAKEQNSVQQKMGSNELPQTEELSKTDIHQLQASSAFGYLLDVLDNDPTVELKSPEKTSIHQLSGDGHNLPDSPFTSPLSQEKATSILLPEKSEGLTLGEQAIRSPAVASIVPNGLTCPICTDFLVDPFQLDCSHTFCVQCILKVIRVSKDECPLCQRHIGSQIAKLLESRGLQVIDALLTTRARGQIIW